MLLPLSTSVHSTTTVRSPELQIIMMILTIMSEVTCKIQHCAKRASPSEARSDHNPLAMIPVSTIMMTMMVVVVMMVMVMVMMVVILR